MSEEEAEAASLVLSTLADNRYKHARAVLLALLAERAALEARLAEAERLLTGARNGIMLERLRHEKHPSEWAKTPPWWWEIMLDSVNHENRGLELDSARFAEAIKASVLAEARRDFAREALEKVFKADDNGTPWESWAGVIDFLRREAGEDGK